ncbi:MAG: L,D-transpeptidase [Caldilineaceae bacterium]|nr:L,D-transpeptidase [Caldilineaceae bacterium]
MRIFPLVSTLCLFCLLALFDARPLSAAPLANGLQTPSADSALSGLVEITGVAQHATFRKWQLDLLLHGDEKQAVFLAVGEQAQPESGLFTTLDTTLYPDGQHQLRLRVVHSNLNYDEYFTPITIHNAGIPLPILEAAHPVTPSVTAEIAPVDLAVPLGEGVPDGRRWIEVDLSDQTLTAWQGETMVLHTSISSGSAQYPTVRGTYPVRTKLPLERMIGPGYDTPNVPWTMYFFRGYAIHGAYWHNNFGTPVSHGCVNMRVDEAKALYDWASIGTEVVVHE